MVTHTTDSRGRARWAGRGRPDGQQSHVCRGQVVGLTDHRPRARMPDIQITVFGPMCSDALAIQYTRYDVTGEERDAVELA